MEVNRGRDEVEKGDAKSSVKGSLEVKYNVGGGSESG